MGGDDFRKGGGVSQLSADRQAIISHLLERKLLAGHSCAGHNQPWEGIGDEGHPGLQIWVKDPPYQGDEEHCESFEINRFAMLHPLLEYFADGLSNQGRLINAHIAPEPRGAFGCFYLTCELGSVNHAYWSQELIQRSYKNSHLIFTPPKADSKHSCVFFEHRSGNRVSKLVSLRESLGYRIEDVTSTMIRIVRDQQGDN